MCKVVDLEKELITKAKLEYKKLHAGIIGTISFMLKTAKIEPMEHLAGLDPSFTSLVKSLELYRDIIRNITLKIEMK